MTKRRYSVRAFLINPNQEILLSKWDYRFLKNGKIIWVTPGGGAEEGESDEAALRREILEETGISEIEIGQETFYQELSFNEGTPNAFISAERFFLVRCFTSIIRLDLLTATEKKYHLETRWWKIDDIDSSKENFGPDNIPEILRSSGTDNLFP